MPERNWTCSYLVRRLFNRNILFLLSLLVVFSIKAQTTDELKKKADKLFKEENYDEAYKYYSQLVSNFPKDPEYNYRLGVCMVYSEPDKTKCLPFLKTAAANPAEAPKEVYFYIGKAYHINYRFDDAIKNYNEFKKTAPPTLQKKLQVDREIQSCNNGKRLLSNVTDLVVLNKKELPKVDYFRSYELKKMGKLLVKPDEFKTALDKKKKKVRSFSFLPNQMLSTLVAMARILRPEKTSIPPLASMVSLASLLKCRTLIPSLMRIFLFCIPTARHCILHLKDLIAWEDMISSVPLLMKALKPGTHLSIWNSRSIRRMTTIYT